MMLGAFEILQQKKSSINIEEVHLSFNQTLFKMYSSLDTYYWITKLCF